MFGVFSEEPLHCTFTETIPLSNVKDVSNVVHTSQRGYLTSNTIPIFNSRTIDVTKNNGRTVSVNMLYSGQLL